MMKITGLLLALILMTGCAHSELHYAYIAPNGSCGYKVMLHERFSGPDPELSKCMQLESAEVLADQINRDMQESWSGSWNDNR